MKIVITDILSDQAIIPKYLPADAEVCIIDKPTPTDEEVIQICKDADAVLSE